MLKLRNQQNYTVPSTSRAVIRAYAKSVREQLGLTGFDRLDYLRLSEIILGPKFGICEFHIEEEEVMGTVEAVTVVRTGLLPIIMVREDVYQAARAYEARALFTICHELGHVLMHAQLGTKVELAPDDCKAFESSEWQANEFAAELLAPAHLISTKDTKDTLIQRFGISEETSIKRLINYMK